MSVCLFSYRKVFRDTDKSPTDNPAALLEYMELIIVAGSIDVETQLESYYYIYKYNRLRHVKIDMPLV